jgi:hypothetical protein
MQQPIRNLLWRNFITFWSDSTSSIVYLTGVILNTSVELLKVKSQKMFLYMFWGNFTVCSELKSHEGVLKKSKMWQVYDIWTDSWAKHLINSRGTIHALHTNNRKHPFWHNWISCLETNGFFRILQNCKHPSSSSPLLKLIKHTSLFLQSWMWRIGRGLTSGIA